MLPAATQLESMENKSSLRQRTKPLMSRALSEATADASLIAEGSQLPSPLSSIDEHMATVITESNIHELSSKRYSGTRRRRSSTKSNVRNTSSPEPGDTQWIDIPLAVALIPPLGSFLTGGDILRDFLLFILLFFYLHQLIKLPWELYLASRPRGRRVSHPDSSLEEERLQNLASSELRTAEFCYLTFSVLTPLFGAALLRYVGTTLTGKDYVSWFSTGVFVLVTGIRPWRHLADRLRSRTEDLQDAVHRFRTINDMPNRISCLEEEIAQLKLEVAKKSDVMALNREVDESLDVLDAAVGKHERLVELGRRSTEERFAALEKVVEEAMREVRGTPQAWTLTSPRTFLEWIRPQAFVSPRTPLAVSPNRTVRLGYRPRLAPVREEEDGNGHIRGQMSSKSCGRRGRQGSGWLDMALFPLHAGRAVLWAIVNFLQRTLV